MRARRLTTALVSVMALVALAGVAQGSAGQPVIQGQSNNAGPTTTSLIASGPGASLAVRNTAAGTALSATTSDGAHYAVVATNGAVSHGAGAALQAAGGKDSGVVASTLTTCPFSCTSCISCTWKARFGIPLFNSSITIHPHIADLVPANIHQLLAPTHLKSVDLILDATDNFETRYLLNDFCVQQSKPWIYAAAIGAYAATMNILPKPADDSPSTPYSLLPTACLACIFPKPPTGPVETCDTAGILSTAVNLAASIQTTEALKLLTNQPHLLRRTLLSHDLWSNQRSEINTSTPNPDCTVCGRRIFSHLSGEGRPHITLCGRNSVQIHEHHRPVDFAAMRDRLIPHGAVRYNNLLLRFERPPHTFTLFPDGRCLIQGTTDITLARTLYARFIGS